MPQAEIRHRLLDQLAGGFVGQVNWTIGAGVSSGCKIKRLPEPSESGLHIWRLGGQPLWLSEIAFGRVGRDSLNMQGRVVGPWNGYFLEPPMMPDTFQKCGEVYFGESVAK
jgi:hypothetical protein